MARSGSAETRAPLTVPRWWFAVVLALSVASSVLSVFWNCNGLAGEVLCGPGMLAPIGLAFPLGFLLPTGLSTWVLATCWLGYVAVTASLAWLLIRRFAPGRIRLWLFLAILLAWTAASYGLFDAAFAFGAPIYRLVHGG